MKERSVSGPLPAAPHARMSCGVVLPVLLSLFSCPPLFFSAFHEVS